MPVDMLPEKKTDLPGTYMRLFDEMPFGIVIIGLRDYRVSAHNAVFSKLTGFSAEDISAPGFSFLSLLDEMQQHRLDIQIARAREYELKRKRYVIYHLRHKSGATAPYCVYAAPVHMDDDPQGESFQLLLLPDSTAFGIPFTSFDTREIFLELFEDFGFGTFEWIIASGKIFCSGGVYRIFGMEGKPHELTAGMVTALLHPADRQAAVDAVRHTFETGDPYNIETRLITPQKTVKHISSIGRLITNERGEPLKLVGSVRDITRQKESDMARKKHFSELNRSNRELEDFAYVTSHDLQEPLRKISTFSDRLSEKAGGMLDDDGSFYLERIKAAADSMRHLINNLLDFSRITEGNLAFAQVHLDFILKEVKADLELKIAETKAVIEAPPLPVIEADPLQIRQLFLNLLSNALKFRRKDVAPQIVISCTALSEEDKAGAGLELTQQFWKLEFTDNGIGFEEEYATRIFQIFQRLHGKAEYPGSGVGLAICKKITDYHHGIIYARGLPARSGACFTVILPEKQF